MIIDKILETARQKKATDVYLVTEKVPRAKVNGNIVRLNYPKLMAEDIDKIALNIMNELQRKKLRECGEVTFSYEVHGNGRYRVNIFRQDENISCSIRCVQNSLDDIDVSEMCKSILDDKGGFVIIAGEAGSGKTTTMSAIVEYINKNCAYNIVTLEKPVEYVYQEENSMIVQRIVGEDIASYDIGIDNSLKMNCDVMVIGELSDKNTIKATVKAAQAGVLVITTMNCSSKDMVTDRLLMDFSADESMDLQNTLKKVPNKVIFQTIGYDENGKLTISSEFVNSII